MTALPADKTTQIHSISTNIACEIVEGITKGLAGASLTVPDQIAAIAIGVETAVREIEKALAPELRWTLAKRFALARKKTGS